MLRRAYAFLSQLILIENALCCVMCSLIRCISILMIALAIAWLDLDNTLSVRKYRFCFKKGRNRKRKIRKHVYTNCNQSSKWFRTFYSKRSNETFNTLLDHFTEWQRNRFLGHCLVSSVYKTPVWMHTIEEKLVLAISLKLKPAHPVIGKRSFEKLTSS